MEKIWLVIQREYITRVTKKSFWLTTILGPLAIVIFYIVVFFIMNSSNETFNVLIKDQGGLLKEANMADTETLFYQVDQSGKSVEDLKKTYRKMGKDALLVIPADILTPNIQVELITEAKMGMGAQAQMKSKLTYILKQKRYQALGYEKEKLIQVESSKLEIIAKQIENGEEKSAGTIRAMVIGSVMGLLIYITIFMYGTMVMRSVMEEKTNRIMEVIISTIKPFQLMMGKIVGVSLVGLTQFFIWGVLLFGFTFIASLFLGAGFSSPPPTMGQMGAEQQLSNADVENLKYVVEEILSANWFKIIGSFVLYFIGGYFLYASLFAAIGSAVSEDMAEGQTLTIPITIPVAISFYIAMASLENPNSTLAIVSSYIPFFSPIVMTTRLGFDPPYWQILLSLVLLYATCILCVWIASRIYRVGVLMYGKKVTFKELAKWAIQK